CAPQSARRSGDPPRKEGAMMQCHEFDELVSPYLANELDPARRIEFDRHLHGCAACRSLLADQRHTDELLRASLTATPVAGTRVQARVGARVQAAPWWQPYFELGELRPLLAAAVWVLAIALLALVHPVQDSRTYLLETAAADHAEDLIEKIEKPGWVA